MKQDLWFNIYDKIEVLFLNNPSQGETSLHANYDKLLHILGSFVALLWLSKIIHPVGSIIIVLLLCILKTIGNYKKDDTYNPAGDWLSNAIGFGLCLCWWLF